MLKDDFIEKNSTKKETTPWPLEKQWEMEDILISEGGFEAPPRYYRTGEEVWRLNIASDWAHFKEDMLEVYSNDSVRVIKANRDVTKVLASNDTDVDLSFNVKVRFHSERMFQTLNFTVLMCFYTLDCE